MSSAATAAEVGVEHEVEDGVGLITLCTSEGRNVLSPPVLGAIGDTLAEWSRGDEVRAAVIAGGERFFAAGADLRWMHEQTADSMVEYGGEPWRTVRGAELPTVACVRGRALGGGWELALACDLIVASEDATFEFPEVSLGLLPGAGGTQHLSRVLGRYRAAEIIVSGRRLGAVEAERLGLANEVAAPGSCLERALAIAAEVAAGPPLAVRLALRSIDNALQMPLEAGIAAERRLFELAFATSAASERIAEFAARAGASGADRARAGRPKIEKETGN